MFTSVVTALALAASVSRVAAGPINHLARGYAQDVGLLEDYTPYHVRYLALSCQDKHNTPFFEECCHPLLRWQKLSERPGQCTPSPSASSSAVLAEPTAVPVDEDPIPEYDDCDDETSSAAPTSTKAAAPASTKIVVYSSVKNTPTSTFEAITSSPAAPEYTSPAPEPTTTPPTTTHKPSSTKPVATAEPTTSAAPSTGGDSITGGFATFFTQNGNAGACGTTHSDDDLIVAADYRRYGALDKQSSLCGKKVRITNPKNGKQVTATVADACPSCTNENCLDLSLGAFDKIATREEGMVAIDWEFI